MRSDTDPRSTPNREVAYPAATFVATRSALTGSKPLSGSAEIARGVCASAMRMVSVLAITQDRMRRIDGWLDALGLVTHVAAPDSGRAVPGSVCDRHDAPALIASIVVSLVGPLPSRPASASRCIGALGAVGPSAMPAGLTWVVVVVATADGDDGPVRLVLAAGDGLLLGEQSPELPVDSEPVMLAPAKVGELDQRLARIASTPTPTLRDLLVD